jgi:hypothetical protein
MTAWTWMRVKKMMMMKRRRQRMRRFKELLPVPTVELVHLLWTLLASFHPVPPLSLITQQSAFGQPQQQLIFSLDSWCSQQQPVKQPPVHEQQLVTKKKAKKSIATSLSNKRMKNSLYKKRGLIIKSIVRSILSTATNEATSAASA